MAQQLDIIPIEDLIHSENDKSSFLIPSYQRGYRWRKENVELLLDDIEEWMVNQAKQEIPSEQDFYCIQPIVVIAATASEGENTQWELIDGQQRLTTLYIILKAIGNTANIFRIDYQTRKRTLQFLQNLGTETDLVDNIDFAYIQEAYTCAKQWLKNKQETKGTAYIQQFEQTILKDVRLIWYQLDKSKKGETKEVFTRINIGKISLTNSELIRALFLQKDKYLQYQNQVEIYLNQIKIAHNWDQIEHYFQQDEFWYFLTNESDREEYEYNRIEYIFDSMSGRTSKDFDDFYTFHWFVEQLEAPKEEVFFLIQKVWEEVVVYFATFKEWFEDNTLYHKIGYLISQGATTAELWLLKQQEPTKSAFVKALDNKIQSIIDLTKKELDQLSYSEVNDRKKILQVLLLFNIETILQTKNNRLRFSFHSYQTHDWSLEHIHPQHIETIKREEDKKRWLEDSKRMLELLPTKSYQLIINQIEQYLNRGNKEDDFSVLARQIEDLLTESSGISGNEMHSLGNLTLLDAASNSMLNNTFFLTKKEKIIQLENSGQFIPICTKNVFMNYYHPKSSNLFLWTEEDGNAYLRAIKRVLYKYLR